SHVIFTGYLPDPDVAALLECASIFAFPSLYEGFGMPVLEAMACGTPVVTSNSSSLPEVVGDAGVLLDPEDADGFAKAMGRFIDHEEDIEHINEKMALQVEKFSWNATTLAYGHGIFDVIQ
ncbi:MAG TPA: glycosyltransferase, partial [Bacillota bacterium]|nr:glycosyltransferase [Bacillota bacterium]